jgi:hypothetical protein
MLAPLLVASLVSCVVIMLAGWVHDTLAVTSDRGDVCPLFPASARRPGGV